MSDFVSMMKNTLHIVSIFECELPRAGLFVEQKLSHVASNQHARARAPKRAVLHSTMPLRCAVHEQKVHDRFARTLRKTHEEVSRGHRVDHSRQRQVFLQSYEDRRRLECERIEKENVRFSRRLINAKASLTRDEQRTFFEKHCKLKQRLRRHSLAREGPTSGQIKATDSEHASSRKLAAASNISRMTARGSARANATAAPTSPSTHSSLSDVLIRSRSSSYTSFICTKHQDDQRRKAQA